MKGLLRFIVILIIVIALLICAAALFILTFDINRLKPVIEDAAAKHGATLSIPGDLSWQFFPALGLQLGEINLSNGETGETLATINSASVSVQIKPLLQREIRIEGLYLDGMQANYALDPQGVSNWQPILDSLSKPTTAGTSSPKQQNKSTPQLQISTLNISNLTLRYSNAADGTEASIRDAHLRSQNFALDGQTFSLDFSAAITYSPYPTMNLTWQGDAAVDLGQKQAKLTNGRSEIRAKEGELTLTNNLQITWAPELNIQGQTALKTSDLRALAAAFDIELPVTADDKALQAFALDTKINLQGERLTLDPTTITVDQTQLQGKLLLDGYTSPKIVTQWQGDRVDLDRYLPPASDAQTQSDKESQPPSSAKAEPQPLPFDAIQALNLDFKLAFAEVTAKQLAILQPDIRIRAQGGLVMLQTLTAQVLGGSINSQGVMDARKKPAQLDLNIDVQEIDVQPLLQTFADMDNLAGLVTTRIGIVSTGATDTALVDNLVAHIEAESSGLKLTPVNLEEQFCKAAALLQTEPLNKTDWPAETKMEPVRIQAQYEKDTITLESLSAEVADLLAVAEGKIQLDSGKLEIPVKLSLGEFAKSIPGCVNIKEKYRKRILHIRCKGKLDSIGAKTCLPDTDLVKDALEDKAKEKLEAEQDRAEERLKDKAKELLNKELGEEKAKEAEQNLRDLLKKLKGKE